MRTIEGWSPKEEQPASLARRAWRRLAKRIVNLVYAPGDSLADISKRAAVFILGWGSFISLLTWAGYRNGNLHGVGEGILWACGLFLAAVLFAPDYLTPRVPRRRRH
jgi:dolichol kinase